MTDSADTDKKIVELKALQKEIGKPAIPNVFEPKTAKDESKELLSGLLIAIAFIQYFAFGIKGFAADSQFYLILAPTVFIPLCLFANRVCPIRKVQAGEPGLASGFNYIVVNFLFYVFAEWIVLFAFIGALLASSWMIGVYLAIPVVAIIWIKRQNKNEADE